MDIDEMRRRYREKNGQQDDGVSASPSPAIPNCSNEKNKVRDEHNAENVEDKFNENGRDISNQSIPKQESSNIAINNGTCWKSKIRENALWIILCVSVLIVASLVTFKYISKSNFKKHIENQEQQMFASDTVFHLTREDIIGNYSVKIESNGQLKRLTGYIDYDAIGQCVLHVLSDYEPMLFILHISGNGIISNDELGDTYLIYQRSIDKKTITFKKNNTTCTLTK